MCYVSINLWDFFESKNNAGQINTLYFSSFWAGMAGIELSKRVVI